MTWAGKRQLQYISGILFIIAIVVFILIYPSLTEKPTCSDGKQNGTETGVDCGGICFKVCSAEVSEPIVLWSRAFHLTGSIYNLVALVANQNHSAAVQNANYEFKVYNTANKFIGRRDGSTYIPPNKQFAIFESRFDAGQETVKSVSFDLLPPLSWVKLEPTLDVLPIETSEITMGTDRDFPTLNALLTNNSIYNLPAFDVVTILYDVNHNAINASKTHLLKLDSNKNSQLLFTWPEALPADAVTKDILIQINPFTTSF